VPFEWSSDIEQAGWLVDVLHPFARDVGSVIPDTFEAYARVFHPVLDDDGIRRTWTELAEANGRIAHPEMQLHEIGRPRGTPRSAGYDFNNWINRASWGSLPREELVALRDTLALHTIAPNECWCCVWDGYGQLHGGSAVATLSSTNDGRQMAFGQAPPIAPRTVLEGPRVSAPGRDYFLLGGHMAELADLFESLGSQSPNIWWPNERAWCVATEIDFAWTYVGGSAAAIRAVLADPRLEALPAKLTDRFTHDNDVLNAASDLE
jgi:hypothetical protein